jgi:hypothetical protein
MSALWGIQVPDHARRHARRDAAGRYLAADDGVGPDHGTIADSNAAHDRDLSPNPHICADHHRIYRDLPRRRRETYSVVVIANGDELSEKRARTDLDARPRRNRAAVSDEHAGTEGHASLGISCDRRGVINLATLTQYERRARIEDETAPLPHADPTVNLDARMEQAPCLRPRALAQFACPRVKQLDRHRCPAIPRASIVTSFPTRNGEGACRRAYPQGLLRPAGAQRTREGRPR